MATSAVGHDQSPVGGWYGEASRSLGTGSVAKAL
jgi:hypothetical protein